LGGDEFTLLRKEFGTPAMPCGLRTAFRLP